MVDAPNYCSGAGEIQMLVDDTINDLNEIVKTRVRALGGNSLIGYKVKINSYEQNDERR